MKRSGWLVIGLVAFLTLLTACSSGSKASPTARPVAATNVYRDPRFHFSFHYPADWKAPTRGQVKSLGGVQTYVLGLSLPNQVAGVEVRVSGDLSDYSKIPDGKVVVDPGNPNQRFRYHKIRVSGWPSILIERYVVNQPVDEYVTVTNTRKLSYTEEMVTPNPPFPRSAVQGYRLILDTMKIPFG